MHQSLQTRAWISVLIALFLLVPCVAFAQVNTGSLSGTVIDAQKALIDGAEAKLINKDTNKEYNTVTDSSGALRFTLLPQGTYRLEVSKTGFRKIVLEPIAVNVGADTGLGSIQLELGEITTSVEVTTAAPVIENTQAQITSAITTSTIAQFPGVLENQGLDSLALTVPGVVNNRDLGFSNTNGMGFAVNGLRGRNNDQQIDGQNNNDNSVAGPSLAVSDSEFVSEYQITTSNFGAEYGRNSGSVVNVVTKSGTNNVHGSLYGTESNQRFNTLSSSQKAFEDLTSVPTFNDLFLGGTIGGPIIKDKLFFFGGDNAEIINQSQVFGTGLLTPTPAGIATLAACYPGSPGVTALQTYGPYAIKGGNPVPQGTVQPVDFAAVPASGGVPAIPGCAGVDEAGIQRTLNGDSRQYNFVIKLDFQTEKNHFYGRYIYSNTNFFNIDPGAGGAASGYPYNEPALSQDYGFSWVRNISTRMANEFRASYGRLNVQFGNNSLGTIPPQQQIDQGLTNIVFSNPNVLGFGPSTAFPQGRIVNTYQFQDNWTYFHGRNSYKAGVNYTYQRSPNTFLPNFNGQYLFGDYNTLAYDVPTRIRIASGSPSLDFREHDTFVYFQDDIKISNTFTLNAGLTYSYYGQPANLFHNKTVANQTGSDPLWNPALPLSVTTFPSIPAPKNSFGPNVGFAWSPRGTRFWPGNGKTVIRGGYRLSYDPPFYNIYTNIASAAPNVLLNSITDPAIAAANPMPANPLGPAVRTALAPLLQTGVFDPRTFNETSISPNFGPDKVHSWSLGVQQEINQNAAVEVRYVGNAARNLFQTIDGNPFIEGLANLYPSLVPAGLTPCPAGDAAPGVPQAVGRANCNEGIIRERTNTGFSNYNALQTEVRLNRVWHQLTLKSAYTFSKTMDNTSEIFGTGAAGGTTFASQNQVNFLGAEYGLSGLDIPNNWVLTVIEEIPFYRDQHGWRGHVLGGWAVSGVYSLGSGQPYTPVQGALNCASGGGACGAPDANNPYDPGFNGAFVGLDGALRPYIGSPRAPVGQVGIFAGDACNAFGVGCALSTTQLISLNAINQGDTAGTPVTAGSVRFIANGAVSNQVFGTPFGNAGRNILRDYHLNTTNIAIFKTTNISERFRVQFHVDFINAFNHPNFGLANLNGIDPFIDDAGLAQEFTGFANPTVQDGGIRSIRFGLKLQF
ncbi:MAG TPA: TonB-dependent receptor [Candidatus Saccharimonadales bacterium]|nr:TonB-dependent receptor [Candidatus Saccharimonadales bacterium]